MSIEPHDDDIRLVGDPHRLEQAVQNLASNALRHTPPGGTVRLGASRDDGKVKLTVTDTGVGIPAAAPAARVRSLLQGRSVALASRRIGTRPVDREGDRRAARRHASSVRSRQGAETVFEIVLPRARSDRREHALKQVGVIGEQLEQRVAIDAQQRASVEWR